MILPDKVIKIDDALLYKALQYYRKSKKIKIKSKNDITYLTILYSFGYIDYEILQKLNESGGIDNEIKITKNK